MCEKCKLMGYAVLTGANKTKFFKNYLIAKTYARIMAKKHYISEVTIDYIWENSQGHKETIQEYDKHRVKPY